MELFFTNFSYPLNNKFNMILDIQFSDKSKTNIIRFSDFDFQFDSILKRILFKVTIQFDFFNANLNMEWEEADFLYLKDGVEKIYCSSITKLIFKPMIDQRIYFEFTLMNNESVMIDANVFNDTYTGTLKFIFETNLGQMQIVKEQIANILMNTPRD